jgi:ribonucleoside-diphosphate reductase alpha chain
VRASDTLEDLERKVRIATILGTLQATQTNFRYLRNIWKKNTDEERLLGVSLTGVMDHQLLSHIEVETKIWLNRLRQVAIETNKEWAERLGINQSTAITCNKPSGTVSQLTDSASGVHPRFAKYYIRRIRGDVKDPLTQFMENSGIPSEADVMNKDNLVFSFPMKAPNTAVCVKDITAELQLEHWKMLQQHWCEHNPSITIYYKDSEFLSLGQAVYNDFDKIAGISFLPHSDHKYQQAPYEEITEEQYQQMVSSFPQVDWEVFKTFENEDNVNNTRELACSAGVCEIV